MITIQSVTRTLNGSGLNNRHTALDGCFVPSGITLSFTVISSLSCSANHLPSCPLCSLSRSFSFTQSFQSLSVLSCLILSCLSFHLSVSLVRTLSCLTYLLLLSHFSLSFFLSPLSLSLPLSFCLPPSPSLSPTLPFYPS